MARMAIGAEARAASGGVETIRFSEHSGLPAPSTRTAAGYRPNAPDAVQRVIFPRRIQHFGFTLAEASEFLTLQEEGAACADGQRMARGEIAALEEQIAHLTETRDALVALVAHVPDDRGTVLLGDDDGPGRGPRETDRTEREPQ